jgi:hypothetical protein
VIEPSLADLPTRLYETYDSQLVQVPQAADCDAESIDISPDQAALAAETGVTRIRQWDFRAIPAAHLTHDGASTATDIPEHLAKPRFFPTLDDVAAALAPSGVFAGRVPNAISPPGGPIRSRDFTHQIALTARSTRPLASAADFDSVLTRSSPPVAHGPTSAAQLMVRQVVSACHRNALTGEPGMLRGHLVAQNLTFAVCNGAAEIVNAAEGNPA